MKKVGFGTKSNKDEYAETFIFPQKKSYDN